VSYGLCLEPGSEASKEAAKKRRNDAGAGLVGKRAKVFGRKVVAPMVPKGLSAAVLKAPAAQKGSSVASSKASSSHARSVPKAIAPLKTGAPPKAAMPKSVATQAMLMARVLKINTKGKWTASAEPSPMLNGKHANVNVEPFSGSTLICRAIVRP
jgi:hypothetical protein